MFAEIVINFAKNRVNKKAPESENLLLHPLRGLPYNLLRHVSCRAAVKRNRKWHLHHLHDIWRCCWCDTIRCRERGKCQRSLMHAFCKQQVEDYFVISTWSFSISSHICHPKLCHQKKGRLESWQKSDDDDDDDLCVAWFKMICKMLFRSERNVELKICCEKKCIASLHEGEKEKPNECKEFWKKNWWERNREKNSLSSLFHFNHVAGHLTSVSSRSPLA